MRNAIAASSFALIVGAAGPAWAGADRYAVTQEEHAACDGDAVRLCSGSFPDQDLLVACMKANQGQLTRVCFSTLKAGLLRRHMSL